MLYSYYVLVISLFNYFCVKDSAKKPQLDDCPAENEGDFSDSDSGEAIEEGSAPTTLASESSWGSTVGCNSSKQSRQFHTEWVVGRGNWLRYDRKRQGMLCVLCQKHDRNRINGRQRFNQDTWSKVPCKRLRLNNITWHEESAVHLESVKKERAALQADMAARINPALPAKGMEQAFYCLYFLAKNRIPHTTNFEPLLDLEGILGINIKDQISKARNALYTSDKVI